MATEEQTQMALEHMHTVVENTLLNSLEKSSKPITEATRLWVHNVSAEIINDLNHAGWGFFLSLEGE